MYIVPLAWLYVALMMAVAEATSSQGTVLGACVTFVLYGLMPIGLMLYFMGTPARRRQRLAREAEEAQAYLAAQAALIEGTESAASQQANAGDLASGALVAPVRKEP
jgi:mannose/fructose/N-acetylgalactosamine-specific phosphotransferase system component IID